MPRKILALGEEVHRLIERDVKREARVSNRQRRTAAEDEALRLRTETAQREQHGFGKKTSKAVTDESSNYMNDSEVLESWVPDGELNPTVLSQMGTMGSSLTGQTIMEEIADARWTGKLRPFVEGEPIGLIKTHVRKPAPMLKTRNQIMDERQKVLRERQQRNDRTLELLARRYS